MMEHIEKTRSHLGELHGLAAKTEAAERRILAAAESRLSDVDRMLDRLRPGLESSPENSQSRYLSLVEERGRLQLVISKARSVLG